jgi:subtilisin family serine protease
MKERVKYNIRVVNMSLGTPAVETWRNDPLCRAVRQMTAAGIVVVAAAGNNGKNAAEQKKYTASMFPMKFFEYLAAGRPVVSTDLPAIRPFADLVDIAGTTDEFVKRIDRVLDGRVAPLEQRLAAARANTWDARMDRMLELLESAGRDREGRAA